MNLTTKPTVKAVVEQAKTLENKCQEFIATGYFEYMHPYMQQIAGVRAMLEDLNVAQESLKSAGYSELWLDTVNVSGNLFDVLHLTPVDLAGKSKIASQELFEQGFVSTIIDWLTTAWQVIVKVCKKIVEWLTATGWLSDARTKKSIDELENGWLMKTIKSGAGVYNDIIADVPRNMFVVDAPSTMDIFNRAAAVRGIIVGLKNATDAIMNGNDSITNVISVAINAKYLNVSKGIKISNDDSVGITFDPLPTQTFDFGVVIGREFTNNQAIAQNLDNLKSCSEALFVGNMLKKQVDDIDKNANNEMKKLTALKKTPENTKAIEEFQRSLTRSQNLIKTVNVCIAEINSLKLYSELYATVINKMSKYLSDKADELAKKQQSKYE